MLNNLQRSHRGVFTEDEQTVLSAVSKSFPIGSFYRGIIRGSMWRMGRCCMQELATCVCVCLCSDKMFRRLVFFPNPCEMIAFMSLLVCFCCLSGANDSLEGCLGKQIWEGDEEEEVEGMKEACSSCRLHID